MRSPYDRAVERERLSTADDLGLYSVRLGQLLQRLDGGNATTSAKKLREVYLEIMKARAKEDEQLMAKAMEKLDALINGIEAESNVWTQIFALMESKSKLAFREVTARKVISVEKHEKKMEQALSVFFTLAKQYIKDRKERELFAIDIQNKAMAAIAHVRDDETDTIEQAPEPDVPDGEAGTNATL